MKLIKKQNKILVKWFIFCGKLYPYGNAMKNVPKIWRKFLRSKKFISNNLYTGKKINFLYIFLYISSFIQF